MKCYKTYWIKEPFIPSSTYFSAGFVLGGLLGLIGGTVVTGVIAIIVF